MPQTEHHITLRSKLAALKVFCIAMVTVLSVLAYGHLRAFGQIKNLKDHEELDRQKYEQIVVNTNRLDTLEAAITAHFAETKAENFSVRLSRLEDRVDLLIKLVGTLCLAITSQLIAYLFQLKLRKELSDMEKKRGYESGQNVRAGL